VLSRLEYDLCWEHLQLGEQPTALAIDGHGSTMDERRELFRDAWTSLADRGFVDRSELDEALAGRLRVLARPERELDARLRLDPDGPRVRAMGAVRGRRAVVAVLTAEYLVLDVVEPTELAAAMVGLLPDAGLPQSRSITVQAELLDRAAAKSGDSTARMEIVLRDGGLTWPDARRVGSVLGNVVGMGQFGAASRPERNGHPGPRQRGPYVVSFYDTPEGRWQFTRRQGWATLAPADHTRLTQAVAELLGESTDS
jgi:hypothetical protein